MSLVEREVTAARVAASQANGKKSKGPKTPKGQARSSLNSIKTGAYAKTDNALRQIMLRRGEDPAFYDQLYLEVTEAWPPDDVMQAMAVKAIAEKSFDKAQLRAAWMEGQLNGGRHPRHGKHPSTRAPSLSPMQHRDRPPGRRLLQALVQPPVRIQKWYRKGFRPGMKRSLRLI